MLVLFMLLMGSLCHPSTFAFLKQFALLTTIALQETPYAVSSQARKESEMLSVLQKLRMFCSLACVQYV